LCNGLHYRSQQMAINFPDSPTVGQTFTVGLKVYTWDGTKWVFDFRNFVSGTSAQRPTVTKPYVYYNTTLRAYEVYLPEYSRWEQVSTYAVTENPTSEYGEASYVVPGTYSWVAPAGVYYVNAVCVGGGAGGRSFNGTTGAAGCTGGAGGGLGWKNLIPVVPDTSYTVVVGAGGATILGTATNGNTNPGGNSYFINTSTVAGFGGGSGTFTTQGTGGSYTGDGGGFGGDAYPTTAISAASGGGGAGGYTGNGGNGGYYNGALVAALAGSGGAGGGGGAWYVNGWDQFSGGGGGVGILGQGTSGALGAASSSSSIAATRGGGGSGGTGGTLTALGGEYGGGAGVRWGQAVNYAGGGGAVRLIWGPDRAFPATNTGVL
jgi:hypothetical protein